jgi:protein tyrosine phosphatase
MKSAIEIIPRLYLGSYEAAKDFMFISENDISVIVNCTKNLNDCFGLNLLKPLASAPLEVQDWLKANSFYIEYYRIPVDDAGRTEDIGVFTEHLKTLVPKIIEEYKQGRSILVHCLAGVQRSAAFVVAFLMAHEGMSLDQSIEYVLNKKPNVFFFGNDVHFMESLREFGGLEPGVEASPEECIQMTTRVNIRKIE